MTDATALYQETILEHGHRPRSEGPLPEATHEATVDNPLCGDRVTLRLVVEDGVVRVAKFEARGCLIATAAASLLCEALAERSVAEAEALIGAVVALEDATSTTPLGALEVLAGARSFPARIACATLAAQAAVSAFGARR